MHQGIGGHFVAIIVPKSEKRIASRSLVLVEDLVGPRQLWCDEGTVISQGMTWSLGDICVSIEQILSAVTAS